MLLVPMSVCACACAALTTSTASPDSRACCSCCSAVCCLQTDRQAQEVGHSRSRQVSTHTSLPVAVQGLLLLEGYFLPAQQPGRGVGVVELHLPHFWVRRCSSICTMTQAKQQVSWTQHIPTLCTQALLHLGVRLRHPRPHLNPLAPVSHRRQCAHVCVQHCAMLCCAVDAAAPSTACPIYTLTLWEHPHALELCTQQHAALCDLNVQIAKLQPARQHLPTGRTCSKADATQ